MDRLCDLITYSLKYGVFKIPLVISMRKKSHDSNIDNYRPMKNRLKHEPTNSRIERSSLKQEFFRTQSTESENCKTRPSKL